ncbi:MAG: endonuclease/exonuclease/phosphatase family protein [Chitinophagaceae bacterium]|nr:endonuclease/exonuclease/phosphatase family protein [Anaerolineae bacterium]
MLSRLRSVFSLRPQPLFVVEGALIGVFFIQALRFLVAMLYSRIASASQFPALDPAIIDRTLPGLVDPNTISSEITFLVYMIALPLLTLIIGRLRWLLLVGAGLAAVGRYFMVADSVTFSAVMGAAMAVGGGLFYITMLTRHRPQTLPLFFTLAIAIDQIFRAAGNTLDPSWSGATIVLRSGNSILTYQSLQIILSIIAVSLTFATLLLQQRQQGRRKDRAAVTTGLMTIWSGIGMGGLLYLEMALLALPNAMIARGSGSYILYPILVPLTIAATLLPLVPWVRVKAREFISLFDSSVRGWSWMLFVALLVVLGTRIGGTIAVIVLVAAQFFVSMMWWWLPRPQAQKERSFSAIWVILGVLVFTLLVIGDSFTFEYAFVRNLAPQLNFLNDIIPPLLRGFRGLGLAVLLLAVFLAALPMVQTRRRIPWPGGGTAQSLAAITLVAAATIGGAFAAQPPLVEGLNNPELVRIATYNVHAGYNEFWHFDLEATARAIQQSGANVVLLQEVETGRLTSFGVDQVLWLARELEMDARFYPTNGSLQGLAVLSRIEIVFDDGYPLTSLGIQTGLQRVQIRPDGGVITIYNTWLGVLLATDAQRTPLDQEKEQLDQLSEISAIINSQFTGDSLGRSRTVIGGTFNNVPDSDLIQLMRESGLNDPFAGAPLDDSATFVRTGQRARLDYLWITNNLPLEGAIVIKDNSASDHRLAVIEVRLR